MRRFLLLGTDTGVGKTFVAGLLCSALLQAGLRVVACKPVETGSPAESDLDAIARLCGEGSRSAFRTLAGYRFALPAAPAAAARAEGKAAPTAADFAGIAREAERGADAVVVEGCGGALSPLSDHDYVADAARELADYRLVLVAGLRLGVLSHAFGIAHYLRSIGRHAFEIVACDCFGPSSPSFVGSTREDLGRRGLRVAAFVPHLTMPPAAGAADCLAALLR